MLVLRRSVSVRLPLVTLSPETGLTDVDETQTVPLNLHSVPVATTFGIINE